MPIDFGFKFLGRRAEAFGSKRWKFLHIRGAQKSLNRQIRITQLTPFWPFKANAPRNTQTKFEQVSATGEPSRNIQTFRFLEICSNLATLDMNIHKSEIPLYAELKFWSENLNKEFTEIWLEYEILELLKCYHRAALVSECSQFAHSYTIFNYYKTTFWTGMENFKRPKEPVNFPEMFKLLKFRIMSRPCACVLKTRNSQMRWTQIAQF